MTKMLVEAAADLEAKTSDTSSTPLHVAAGSGHWEVVRVLVGAGANPNCRALMGETPLYLAAAHGHLEAVRELFSAKADASLVMTAEGGFVSHRTGSSGTIRPPERRERDDPASWDRRV